MKTAMQILIDEIKEAVPYLKLDIYQPNFDKSLEREKQQLINAWKDQRGFVFFDDDKDELSDETATDLAEQYYNQTFNQ